MSFEEKSVHILLTHIFYMVMWKARMKSPMYKAISLTHIPIIFLHSHAKSMDGKTQTRT